MAARKLKESPDPQIREAQAACLLDALRGGRPGEAARILGRYWSFQAPVVHGDARGRTLGFPTANMHFDAEDAPAFGVYAVRAYIMSDGRVAARYDGVASFGIRPMFRTATPLLETHLFDFDGDLYGKLLSVAFVAWLRPEKTFAGLDELVAQIKADAAQARAVLRKSAIP